MGRGGRPPPTRETQVSKKLSWLLRHHIEDEGLTMNASGYVNLQDVLNNRNIKSLKVTFDEVREIVASNDKQRFSLIPVPSETSGEDEAELSIHNSLLGAKPKPKDWMIRANQGHSIAVDSESLLTKIDQSNMPTTVVHGTTHSAWLLIVASGGLKRMTRQHVHFASGLPASFKSESSTATSGDEPTEAAAVVSGMRNSSSVLVYLDIEKALGAGINFWLSDNGVILTEGDADGLVPLEYFKTVEDRRGEGILVQDGKIIKQAPESWQAKGQSRQPAAAKAAPTLEAL